MYLRKEMERVGMTSAELASIAQVSVRTVKAYERGERQPSIKVAKRIAAVLGFDWTEFFSDDREENAHENDARP